MTTFTVNVHDEAVRAALGALQQRVANMGLPLLALGEQMHERVDKRFSSQTGPDGQAWKPLKRATIKRKHGTTILTDRGHLRQSIVPQVSGNTLTLSAVEPYAAIHHFGGTIQRKAGHTVVAHRIDAKGNLLRRAFTEGAGANFGGNALVFAKTKGSAAHKRAIYQKFAHGAYAIKMPARPFMPIRADGTLYATEQALILKAIEDWIAKSLPR